MGERFEFDKINNAILLFDSKTGRFEEKTEAITAIYTSYYFGNLSGFDIYFRGATSKFFYKLDNVKILRKLRTIDITNYDVYVKEDLVDAKRLDMFEEGYYRVYIPQRNILTKHVFLEENLYKNILLYYSELAEYGAEIAEKDSPLFFLTRNFKKLSLNKGSILFDYLKGKSNARSDNTPLIVPFDFNQSQVTATDLALTNSVSIIEGPPGTGKTQTIINLIANIIYRNKSCAVVSNNNTAIDNIYEKLNEGNLGFIVARLGRKDNIDSFFESNLNDDLKIFLNANGECANEIDSKEFNAVTRLIKEIQDIEVENALLLNELGDIENEKRHLDESTTFPKIYIKENRISDDYLELKMRIEKPKRIKFIEKVFIMVKYKVNMSKVDMGALIENLDKLYYDSRIKELNKKINKNKIFLSKNNKVDLINKKKNMSKQMLDDSLLKRYKEYDLMDFSKDSYKHDYKQFIKRYPVVLSTSHSLLNNTSEGFTFDYLIIDEASQGDLLSSILSMSCAKNLVVVGDSRQLQQIDEERLFDKSNQLSSKYNIKTPYVYHKNSILKSVKDAIINCPVTLLKEHYRCAPDIINFCNKFFYDGKLVVMTENKGRHIDIIKTVPGNHARKNPHGSGLYNQREIDEIGQLLQMNKEKSIGVITPFRYQANLLSNRYSSELIEIDTVHKFQGRQKEEIILSFVVNSINNEVENNIENKLNDFITNEKLLNVAISRGINKITAIVSDKLYNSSNNLISDFIKYAEYLYGCDFFRESSITSVFDYLYKEYTDKLIEKFKGRPHEHKTELLMCEVIDEVLGNNNYIGYSMHTSLRKLIKNHESFTMEEKLYIYHPWTHVDFLFYNKVNKEVLFVLEVDGIRFHEQNLKQEIHDDIKTRALAENNIPLYRFKTNEANERERISDIINLYKR